ncbi:MAG: glycosyltransferase [Actinomycetota bacterium]
MSESVSVVVPVYQGEHVLDELVAELALLVDTEPGREWRVVEVVLVWDGAIDDSDLVMRRLERQHPWIRIVWLSRNYGQHAATIAGIASTTSEWVVTMDEDGLHDPASIAQLFRAASQTGSGLVYGVAATGVPHGWYRNLTSRLAKLFVRYASGLEHASSITSFRLLDGPSSRSLVAYAGHDVYLDVALSWALDDAATVPVTYRAERRPAASGYRVRSLLSHFRRLVVTSGTKPLRFISAIGLVMTVLAFIALLGVIAVSIFGEEEPRGWASAMATSLLLGGLILVALGVISEYLSVAIGMASGRPLYMLRHRPPRRAGPPITHREPVVADVDGTRKVDLRSVEDHQPR